MEGGLFNFSTKKPPYNNPANFRPISITSIFCRPFEKILKEAVLTHLETQSVLPREQHGFRNGKSMKHADFMKYLHELFD